MECDLELYLFFFNLHIALDGSAAADGLRDRAILLMMVHDPLSLSFFALWYFQTIFDMDARDQRLALHVFDIALNFSRQLIRITRNRTRFQRTRKRARQTTANGGH